MSDTTFSNGVTLSDGEGWAQDVNDYIYRSAMKWCGTAGGTADAITITPVSSNLAPSAYLVGQTFVYKSGSSANTGAMTVAVNGMSTKAIQHNGAAMTAGEHAANKWYRITYDGAAFQLEALRFEVAATSSVSGLVELATSTEINTGTDSTRAIPIDQYVASNRNVRYVVWRVLGATTDCGTGTTIGGDFEIPFTGTLTEIGAHNDTAGTTGTMTVDVNKAGTTLMTTNKITIDSTEKSSRTAATAAALTTTAVTAGDVITVDIDAVHTTAAKGLTVRFGIRMT